MNSEQPNHSMMDLIHEAFDERVAYRVKYLVPKPKWYKRLWLWIKGTPWKEPEPFYLYIPSSHFVKGDVLRTAQYEVIVLESVKWKGAHITPITEIRLIANVLMR